MDPHVDLFIEATQRDMVEFIGAYSDQAAAPELKQGTATAAQLSHDQSMGLVSVPLALKAEADIRTFEGILRLVQKHWDAPRYLPLLGSRAMIEGELFDAAKIPQDYMLVLADQSWLPRNATEKRNDLLASFQISPALPLGPFTPGLPPFLARHICEVFNQPYDEDSQAAAARLAAYKTGKIIELAEQLEESGALQQADPLMAMQMVLEQFPPNPRIDLAEPTTLVITEFLTSDKGINSSPFIQKILDERINQVEMAAVMNLRKQAMMAAASNPLGMQQGGDEQGNGKPPSNGQPPKKEQGAAI